MDDTLKRPFGFWMTTALVVGSMVGAGIFVLPAQFATLGATGAAAWVCAIAGSLFIAWTLIQLLLSRPGSTGIVAVCGEILGPVAGILLGWSYWTGIWSSNAIVAIVGVRYLALFAPWLNDTSLHSALSACGLIWLLTALNLGGARAAGRFQVVTTGLKLLPLVAVVVILIGLVLAEGKQFAATPHAPFDAGLLTPALAPAFLALVGFECAMLVADRVRSPARTIPLATMAGLTLTGLLYLVVCSGIVFALPDAVTAAAPTPVALFVETFWGRGAALAVAAFAAISAIGCLNGWILMQGEVPLGMARAGLLPRWFGRVSPSGVPVRLLVLSSLLATVLVLSTMTRSAANLLDFMLRLTAATSLWLYIGGCVAALMLKISRVFAVLGLVFSAWTMWGVGLEAGAWSLALMLTALPLYWLRPKTAVGAPDAISIPAR